MKQPSQNDRILAILSDGDWHEKSEFYSFCILHSRIPELRRRGHVFEIEKRHGGRTVWYRLSPLRERPDADCLGPAAAGARGEGSHHKATMPRLPQSIVPNDEATPPTPLSTPEQLTLEAA